jgi:hypothetical protein
MLGLCVMGSTLGDRWQSAEVINSRAPYFNAKMSPSKPAAGMLYKEMGILMSSFSSLSSAALSQHFPIITPIKVT